MGTESNNEFGHWVGNLARRAAAFLCIARVYERNAQRVERNLQRAAQASLDGLTPLVAAKLPPPKSLSRPTADSWPTTP
jgi:hypothetical protein